MKTETHLKTENNQRNLTSTFPKVPKLLYGILVIPMLLLSQTAAAQINLEHTFEENAVWSGSYYIEPSWLPRDSYYNLKLVENSYVVKIYNADYSIRENTTYSFTPPVGYKVKSVSMSLKQYNTDNNYEFMVIYERTDNIRDDTRMKAILHDQNGGIIKDFGFGNNLYIFPYLQVFNNQLKLRLERALYNGGTSLSERIEIYSMADTPPTSSLGNKVNESQPPYPNPASSVITLPYQLEQGEISVMNIYNMSGQLIDAKLIDAVFDKILLNVSDYTKGMYIYEVNGVSNRFVVD